MITKEREKCLEAPAFVVIQVLGKEEAELMNLSGNRRCIKFACWSCYDLMKYVIPEACGFKVKE